MKKGEKLLGNISVRYLILFVLGLLGNEIFYLIFLPLTIFPVNFLLKFFFSTSLVSSIIYINNLPIEIIGACVAGSAYYLLLILNLSTPGIKIKKRIALLIFTFLSLLILNVLRIFLLSMLFVSGTSFFDLAHKLFWYAGSTLFVVGIWFLGVWLFKIKEIPFYSDIKSLCENYKKIKTKKKR
ncbi:Uncharacterised protein [uncultured archaeon]|nr:Uncharacterised protein [uncultured archaeon]